MLHIVAQLLIRYTNRRLAHRLRDIQALPYVVVQNPHIKNVYETYYKSFDRYRRTPEIKSTEDNEKFCDLIRATLSEHLTVIPGLAIGVLEVQGLMRPEETDKFMADNAQECKGLSQAAAQKQYADWHSASLAASLRSSTCP